MPLDMTRTSTPFLYLTQIHTHQYNRAWLPADVANLPPRVSFGVIVLETGLTYVQKYL